MENPKAIQIDGVEYKYVSPEDFTFRQFKIGKKIARQIMPILQKAGVMNELDGQEDKEKKLQVDTEKLIDLLKAIDETENNFDETDIIALCYQSSKYKKFNESDYNKTKELLKDLPATQIEELRGCVADFFMYTMPRITDGILTSLGTMTEQPKGDVKNIESIVEAKV